MKQKGFSKFLLFFTPVLVLSIVAVGIVFRNEAQRTRRDIEGQERRVVMLAADLIRSRLQTPKQDLLYLSQLQSVTRFLSDDPSALMEVSADFDAFVRQHRDYDQLRILGMTGRELVRINRTATGAEVVPERQLQAKGDRYYFQDGFREKRGQVYVSPLDLNVEHGRIERPFKPTIRLATPLYNNRGQKRGVLVLNYLAAPLLQSLRDLGHASRGEFWLLNREGYALLAPHAKDEFAFMFPTSAGKRLPTVSPKLWSWLRTHATLTGTVGRELVTHLVLCGAPSPCATEATSRKNDTVVLPFAAQDQPWTLITEVSPKVLYASNFLSRRFVPVYILLAILVFIAALSGRAAWKLSGALRALTDRERELRHTKGLVESFIEKSPVPVYIKSRETGRYQYANRAFSDMHRRTPESVVDATEFDLTSDAEAAAARRTEDKTVIETGQPHEYVREVHLKTGARHLAALKFPIRDDDGRTYAVGGIVRDLTERVEAERALARNVAFLTALLDAAPDAILTVDPGGKIVMANTCAERIFGYTSAELIATPLHQLVPDAAPQSRAAQSTAPDPNPPVEGAMGTLLQTNGRRKDGTSFPAEVGVSPVAVGTEQYLISIVRDVTERHAIEQQLQRSQKMESIGQLTGGLAHDFNNLLGVIIGNLELLERSLAGNESALNRVRTAERAAERGADLTKRLLAFSRRQQLAPQPTDVNQLITELLEMLPRTLGSDVRIDTRLDVALPPVLIDAAALENALLNLAINARDAMPDGGSLEFKSEVIHLDQNYTGVRSADITPGNYARISVSDTGSGMPRDIQDKIFEPFFTTKSRGKGTGLGLAMVYGFAKQSGGNVRVYSEPGHGTTISLYLPLAAGASIAPSRRKAAAPEGYEAKGTVLVVDDEVDLLEIAVAYLEDAGYRVLHATDGPAALQVYERERGIDLLLTDVVMPGGMNGVALSEELKMRDPAIKVVYSSGFPSSALAERSGVQVDAVVVNKPYRREILLAAVHRALAGSDAAMPKRGFKSMSG